MKRYDLTSASGTGGDHWLSTNEDPEGEWVKYEDVAPLFAVLEVPDIENAIARAGNLVAGFEAVKFERDKAYEGADLAVKAVDEVMQLRAEVASLREQLRAWESAAEDRD